MFGHPTQSAHMMDGVRRALESPNTPAHLKAHLQKRLKGASMIGINPKSTPRKPVVKPAKVVKIAGKKSPAKKISNAKPLLPPEFYGTK